MIKIIKIWYFSSKLNLLSVFKVHTRLDDENNFIYAEKDQYMRVNFLNLNRQSDLKVANTLACLLTLSISAAGTKHPKKERKDKTSARHFADSSQ